MTLELKDTTATEADMLRSGWTKEYILTDVWYINTNGDKIIKHSCSNHPGHFYTVYDAEGNQLLHKVCYLRGALLAYTQYSNKKENNINNRLENAREALAAHLPQIPYVVQKKFLGIWSALYHNRMVGEITPFKDMLRIQTKYNYGDGSLIDIYVRQPQVGPITITDCGETLIHHRSMLGDNRAIFMVPTGITSVNGELKKYTGLGTINRDLEILATACATLTTAKPQDPKFLITVTLRIPANASEFDMEGSTKEDLFNHLMERGGSKEVLRWDHSNAHTIELAVEDADEDYEPIR